MYYERKLKTLLEPEEKGKFVAIEPDTESYFMDKDGTKALLRANPSPSLKKMKYLKGRPTGFCIDCCEA